MGLDIQTTNGTVPSDLSHTDAEFESPSITFETITFSDGTPIELGPTDVVVLVGPNNAGKSVALHELEEHLAGLSQGKVVNSVEIFKSGTAADFSKFVEKNLSSDIQNGNRRYRGYGFEHTIGGPSELTEFWISHPGSLRPLFCSRLRTETRIRDSNAADSIDPLNDAPRHPIHLLLLSDETELRISNHFRQAFGKDLMLYRQGGRVLPLLVGVRPIPDYGEGEDRLSLNFVKRMQALTVPLQEQGDGMRSFASIILHLLAPVTPSVLLLDEPEAFLHPPQAKLIGEIISGETSERAQLFVATHSPDVLQGLVDGAADRLRILRIQRSGNVNRVKELSKDLVKRVGGDSLMKYSSVLDGVFHERVIICESDSDCLFYSSILDVPDVHEGPQPDVLFVHANGKDRMDELARTLVALDVRVDVIADIDILKDLLKFKSIVEALDGDWSTVAPLATSINSEIENLNPSLNSAQMKSGIQDVLEGMEITGEFPSNIKPKIDALFRRASPWGNIKIAGKAGLTRGQVARNFDELYELCNQIGLWIVPVGELEGFCKLVDRKGPRWVKGVLEVYDLANAPELQVARDFVREIWSARSIQSPAVVEISLQ